MFNVINFEKKYKGMIKYSAKDLKCYHIFIYCLTISFSNGTIK